MSDQFEWDQTKNQNLIDRYGIGFEEIVIAAMGNGFLADLPHHNHEKYPHQRELYVQIGDYANVAAYVPDTNHRFLKSFHPCRVATKKYLCPRKP